MKRLLSCFLLCASLSAKSQLQDTSSAHIAKIMYDAGRELVKYQRQFTLGTGLELTGAIVVVAGSATDATTNKSVITVGAGISIIGFLISLAAVSHIGKAGLILKGNSIALPIGRQRKH